VLNIPVHRSFGSLSQCTDTKGNKHLDCPTLIILHNDYPLSQLDKSQNISNTNHHTELYNTMLLSSAHWPDIFRSGGSF